MSPSEPRVIVGLCPERYGVAHWSILYDLLAIAMRHPFIRIAPQHVDQARNLLAKHLLATDYTHLLMLDADHHFPPDIVERLSRWVVRDPSKLVVSALAFRRSQPFEPTIYRTDAQSRVYAFQAWEQGLIPVDLLGTPCILINREVFERVPPPWFEFVYSGGAEKCMGEDIYFARKCKEAGIDLWADTTTIVPHLMDAWADEKTYGAYLEYKEQEAHAQDQT